MFVSVVGHWHKQSQFNVIGFLTMIKIPFHIHMLG